MSINLGIVGDSVMWGQGLRLDSTPGIQAAGKIGEVLNDRVDVVPGYDPQEPLRGFARSGAQVEPDDSVWFVTDASGKRIDPPPSVTVLPSGRVLRSRLEARVGFANDFPHLFETDEEFESFLAASDDLPAYGLYGENNEAFPSVLNQLKMLRSKTERVDLLILNGGINDVPKSQALDPRSWSVETIFAIERLVFGERLSRTLATATSLFPESEIVYCGYWSPFSDRSEIDDIVPFLEELSGISDLLLALNRNATAVELGLTVAGWTLGGPVGLLVGAALAIGFGSQTVDLDDLARKLIARSQQVAAYAHLTTIRTIRNFNGHNPGREVAYAFPWFGLSNAIFSEQSYFHEGFLPSGSGDRSASDALVGRREANIPRFALAPAYEDLKRLYLAALSDQANSEQPAEHGAAVAAWLRRFRELIEADEARSSTDIDRLPTPIRVALPLDSIARLRRQALRGDTKQPLSKMTTVMFNIAQDEGRIRTASIASFLHPNEAGADRTARRIADAWSLRGRHSMAQLLASAQQVDSEKGLGRAVRDLGHDPASGLRSLAKAAPPTVVSVEIDQFLADNDSTSGAIELRFEGDVYQRSLELSDGRQQSAFGMWLHDGIEQAFLTDTDIGLSHLTSPVLTFEVGGSAIAWPAEARVLVNGELLWHLQLSQPEQPK